jgi:rod shape-determining protein MreB and related proteins
MSGFLSNFSRLIAIDLGSNFTRVWTDKEGIIINEPSYIAIDQDNKKVVAVGSDAYMMKGRSKKNIVSFSPIRNGKIYDLDLTKAMLKVFLQKVLKSTFFSPNMMISVPARSTKLMQKTAVNLLYSLGANQAYMIRQPLAAAVGAGVPIADASGCFVFQMGAGLCEAAIISLGSMVDWMSSKKAGNLIDEHISLIAKKNKEIVISQDVASKIKQQIGTVDQHLQTDLLISGKDLRTASPKELKIDTSLTREALLPIAEHYIQLLKDLLSKIPPQLTVDVIDKGMLLSGGLAQLGALDDYFVDQLGVPVSVIEEPELAVIKGMAAVLENIDEFKSSLGYEH